MIDKKKLLESDTFCMYPWVHMYSAPNGNTYPCCMSPYNEPFGNIKKESLEDVWNSEKMKELRVNMMSLKETKVCDRCYILDKHGSISGRKTANIRFSKDIDLIDITEEDGYLPKMEIKYMDIRFSNLCNFKCRTCGPDFSSLWNEDFESIFDVKIENKVQSLFVDEDDAWNNLDKILPFVEFVYFAGGEPLIMPEHYKVLDYLIENKKTHVPLGYNTNFSKTSYGGKSIFEYWNQFESVYIGASLDASGNRGEYLRKGTKWDKIVENIKKLKILCPRVKFVISATVSLYNIWHLPDFFEECVDNGYIREDEFMINPLHYPNYLSATVLPSSLKKEISKKFLDLRKKRNLNDQIFNHLNSIVEYMNSKDDSNLTFNFFNKNSQLDLLRLENFYSVFPELSSFKL